MPATRRIWWAARVRDLLLGGTNPRISTSRPTPAPTASWSLFPNSGQVGAHFGVVLVRDLLAQVEVATFRSDNDYNDGRRPPACISSSDPFQDVLRRDFTINGLMMEAETGERFSITWRAAPTSIGA
jgi:tRNA nucleotidyltransferase/poly(A) polymerase